MFKLSHFSKSSLSWKISGLTTVWVFRHNVFQDLPIYWNVRFFKIFIYIITFKEMIHAFYVNYAFNIT